MQCEGWPFKSKIRGYKLEIGKEINCGIRKGEKEGKGTWERGTYKVVDLTQILSS